MKKQEILNAISQGNLTTFLEKQQLFIYDFAFHSNESSTIFA